MTFDEALEAALQSIKKLQEAADDAAFATTVQPVREALVDVSQALATHAAVPGLLVRYLIAVQQATDQIVLKPPGAAYTADEQRTVRAALATFVAAANNAKAMQAGLARATPPKPLLDDSWRVWVAGGAVALFILAATAAALGSWSGIDAENAAHRPWWSSVAALCMTLSYWLGFGFLALGSLWVVNYFTLGQASFLAGGSARSGSAVQYLVFGGLAFLVLTLLFIGVLQGSLTSYLTNIPSARGLITFLIAIGTIAIAVILTLASVVMSADNSDELKERLSKGKEILTVLVGVLGTIVGFYFANNVGGTAKLNVVIGTPAERQEFKVGDEVNVLAFASGGEQPYQSPTITAKDSAGTKLDATATINDQGVFRSRFTPGVAGRVTFTIEVKDKSAKTGAVASEIEVIKK
jgi:hypothetical protein